MSLHDVYQQALRLHQQGQLAQAEVLYQQVLRQQPQHASALHYLGLIYYQTERLEAAKTTLEKALSIDDNNIDLIQHYALCLRELGDIQQALYHLQRAHDSAPQDTDVMQNLANTHWHQDNYPAACALYQTCHRLLPHDAEVRESYSALLVLWGNQAQQQGDYAQAKQCFVQAIAINPPQAALFYNLANAERELGELHQAQAHYWQALQLSPADADSYNNLGNIARELGDLPQALQHYQTAIQLNPGLGHALVHLVHQQQHACDWQDLDTRVRQIQDWVNTQAPQQISPFAFLSMPETSAQQQLQCANLWLSQRYLPWFAMAKQLAFRHDWQHQTLRIGYLSADFRQHPLAQLIPQLLECHQRQQFEIHAYSCGKDDQSPERKRFMQAVDYFHDIRSDSPLQAAQRIHAHEIDILVDLTGFTQNSRAQIAALKPSPVSINWLGYPGTMGATPEGVPLYDYLFADTVLIPPEQQQYYAERILYLPCYQPNDTQRPKPQLETRQQHQLPDDAVVYACFNQTFKILPTTFASWMRILQQVPNSVLWLLECHALARDHLLKAAQQHGVAPHRLIFAARTSLQAHINRMALADVFLDTHPYNAHTSASDALWAGLPVLTYPGATMASRVCSSLLHALGMPELVCRDQAHYQEMAIQLGMSPQQRQDLRYRLQTLIPDSLLFDAQRCCTAVEQHYLALMQHKR